LNPFYFAVSREPVMYKRILVPVDGSESSKKALSAALDLAREQVGWVHIVHVCDETRLYVSMDTLPYPPADLIESLRKDGDTILADAVAAARNRKIEADSKLLAIDHADQRISDAIEQEAENWHADLIVVGTHGRRGFRRLLLGSVAENLVRISTKPVLLIRGA
jgi:nucleotide-binding universal stress UspA family protein